ncbi:hypothetical protein NEOLEDRAFT_1029590, partial [Neolentinus lepideus HHB14362 ss-1]
KQTYTKKIRAAIVPHDAMTQTKKLYMEIACLAWAVMLMDLVCSYIAKIVEWKGQPTSFTVPQMRFVKAAISIPCINGSLLATNDVVYLLEGLIDENWEGKFCKYLNNDS